MAQQYISELLTPFKPASTPVGGGGGDSHIKKGGDTRQEISNESLKDTSLSVS